MARAVSVSKNIASMACLSTQDSMPRALPPGALSPAIARRSLVAVAAPDARVLLMRTLLLTCRADHFAIVMPTSSDLHQASGWKTQARSGSAVSGAACATPSRSRHDGEPEPGLHRACRSPPKKDGQAGPARQACAAPSAPPDKRQADAGWRRRHRPSACDDWVPGNAARDFGKSCACPPARNSGAPFSPWPAGAAQGRCAASAGAHSPPARRRA